MPLLLQLPALTKLDLAAALVTREAVIQLAKIKLPNILHVRINCAATGRTSAAALGKAKWPKLQTLDLFDTTFTPRGLQKLANGRWPLLTKLVVSRIHPDIRPWPSSQNDISLQGRTSDPLANSNWPLLEHLDAGGYSCIHLLTSANECRWPKLKYFQASDIGRASRSDVVLPLLEKVALTHLVQNECLQSLLSMGLPALRSVTLDIIQADVIVHSEHLFRGNWPRLQCLHLLGIHSGLLGSRFGLSGLDPSQNAVWPLLQELDLSESGLQNQELSQLVACNWPCMKVLNLSSNQFSAEGVQTLAQADWPELGVLTLCRLSLGAQAMQRLVTATWPLLTNLNLDINLIDREALHVLFQGHWPQLQELSLSRTALKARDLYDACKECLASEVCAYWSLLQSFVNRFDGAVSGEKFDRVPVCLLASNP